jgi:hypothetical protein
MKLTAALICWTPGEAVDVVPYPDHHGLGDRHRMTSGACDAKVHGFSQIEAGHFVMSTALAMILADRVPADRVHAALWAIDEYRAALPVDMPAPTQQGAA